MSGIQMVSLIGLVFGLVFFFGTMMYLHKLNTKQSDFSWAGIFVAWCLRGLTRSTFTGFISPKILTVTVTLQSYINPQLMLCTAARGTIVCQCKCKPAKRCDVTPHTTQRSLFSATIYVLHSYIHCVAVATPQRPVDLLVRRVFKQVLNMRIFNRTRL